MNNDSAKVSIRDETPDDYDAVQAVTIDAFSHSEFGHNGEADLIAALRKTPSHLSIVACRGSAVVGHVLFTPVVIRTPKAELLGMGLAPMSVATNCQRQGIGSLLVTTGLARLSESECKFVVVLGHPDYYPRFGFTQASGCGVVHGFEGIPQDFFFIHKIKNENDCLTDIVEGHAYFQSEFGPQHVGE